jgi:opacity protein-like surface antigen
MRLIFRNSIHVPVLSLFVLIISTRLNAQAFLDKAQSFLSNMEFGLHAGSFIYQGDLTPSKLGSFKTPGFNFSLSASKRINNFLSARANLELGKLRGDDGKYEEPAWRQYRNFNFRTSVTEFTAQVVWDVLGHPNQGSGLSPYLFAGAGFSFLRVRRDASGLDASYFTNESALQAGLTTDLAHTPPRVIPVFPVGLGVRYPLTNKISLSAETSYRASFSDYIDGFSESGNPARKDSYHSLSVGIFYKFNNNNTLACPVIRP